MRIATVLVRDPLAAMVWAGVWLLLSTVGVAASVVTAVQRWPVAWALLPIVVAASVVACVATGQRLEAWWRWRHHGGVLVVANVAVDRDGCGLAEDLFGDLDRLADAVGRILALRVDPRNAPRSTPVPHGTDSSRLTDPAHTSG